MPLFQAKKPSLHTKRLGKREPENTRSLKKLRKEEEENGSVPSLSWLCLRSVADNMKRLWVKDHAENDLDLYNLRYETAPFHRLPGQLVEELTSLLASRGELSRGAVNLLLVPQRQCLSLGGSPGLVTPFLGTLIAARCQALTSLDISSAQHLSSKHLCELLGHLPSLRSLCLAGTPCDSRVLTTIRKHCLALRHLDVSHCHLLSPARLLVLLQGGGSRPMPSTSSCPLGSTLCPPLSLCSLLALDIGFGEGEGDPAAAAAFLLLTLPKLQRLAMEGLGKACELIHQEDFSATTEFTSREGLPCLDKLWREKRRTMEWEGREREEDGDNDEIEGTVAWDELEHEGGREDASGDEGPSGVWPGKDGAQENVGLPETDGEVAPRPEFRLTDAQGFTLASLEALGHLCPHIHSLYLDLDVLRSTTSETLGQGLQAWAGRLRSLSLCFQGQLVHLLPALHVVGASLFSLTLEGVQCHSPPNCLMGLLYTCPRLRNLCIHAVPPKTFLLDWSMEQQNVNPPRLPELRSLSLNFDFEQSQKKPDMFWWSLSEVLTCLLSGSPLLEKLSLVAVPCTLDDVFQRVLAPTMIKGPPPPMLPGTASRSLACLHEISLANSNISTPSINWLIEVCRQLRSLDLTGCWEVKFAMLTRPSPWQRSVVITWP